VSELTNENTQEKTILILDDAEDLLYLMATTIDHFCGYKVLTAKSHHEVKELGQRALNSDLAILDINLGPNEPNGVDVYRWLRDNGFTSKIFFLTGHAPTYPLVVEAAQLGDVEVLCKPIRLETLVEIVKGGYEEP